MSQNQEGQRPIGASLEENKEICEQLLGISKSFDLICRDMEIGGKKSCFYFVDGFVKDEAMLKIMDSLYGIQEKDMPPDIGGLMTGKLPYVEVDILTQWEDMKRNLFSGVLCLFASFISKV